MSIDHGVWIQIVCRRIGWCEPPEFEGACGLHCEPASAVAVSTSGALGIGTAISLGCITNVQCAAFSLQSCTIQTCCCSMSSVNRMYLCAAPNRSSSSLQVSYIKP